MNQVVHRIWLFDRFALDLTRACLRADDKDIELRPKAFEVLRYLAENAGRLVAKQELAEAVWPHVTVSDDSIVQCIRELRLKLGDDDRNLIKTVSRRGHLLDAAGSSPAAGAAPNDRRIAPPQEVTFCRTKDGINLAVATNGNGLPVVKTGTWLTHIENDWKSPLWLPLFS